VTSADRLAEIRARAEYALSHIEGQGLSLTTLRLILGEDGDVPYLLERIEALTELLERVETVGNDWPSFLTSELHADIREAQEGG